jgi:hypothetical protein
LTAYGRAAQTQTFVGLYLLGSRSHGSRGGCVVTVSQCQFLFISGRFIRIGFLNQYITSDWIVRTNRSVLNPQSLTL